MPTSRAQDAPTSETHEPSDNTDAGPSASDLVESRDADVLRAAGAARARELIEHRHGGPDDAEDATASAAATDVDETGGPEGAFDDEPVAPLTSSLPDPLRQRPGDAVPTLAPEPSTGETGVEEEATSTARDGHADAEVGPDADQGSLADTDELPVQRGPAADPSSRTGDEQLLDPEPTPVGPEDAELDADDADDVLHTTAQLAILLDELEDRDQRS